MPDWARKIWIELRLRLSVAMAKGDLVEVKALTARLNILQKNTE